MNKVELCRMLKVRLRLTEKVTLLLLEKKAIMMKKDLYICLTEGLAIMMETGHLLKAEPTYAAEDGFYDKSGKFHSFNEVYEDSNKSLQVVNALKSD